MDTKSLSIVVPTYKEAESLPLLIERLDALRTSQSLDLELLILDDTTINPDESGTSFAEWAAMDDEGNVYSGEIGPQNMRKWVPLYPIFGKSGM